MRNAIAYLFTFAFIFATVFAFAGEPDAGYEKLYWFSIGFVSILMMLPVVLFHMIQWIAKGDRSDSQEP